jgi:hypothetical protein
LAGGQTLRDAPVASLTSASLTVEARLQGVRDDQGINISTQSLPLDLGPSDGASGTTWPYAEVMHSGAMP